MDGNNDTNPASDQSAPLTSDFGAQNDAQPSSDANLGTDVAGNIPQAEPPMDESANTEASAIDLSALNLDDTEQSAAPNDMTVNQGQDVPAPSQGETDGGATSPQVEPPVGGAF